MDRAAAKGLFVIVNTSIYSEPNKQWFDRMNTLAATITEEVDKIKFYKNSFEGSIKNFLNYCTSSTGFGGILLGDEPKTEVLRVKFSNFNNLATYNQGVNTDKDGILNGSYYSLSNRYSILLSLLNDFPNAVLMLNLVGEQDSDYVTAPNNQYNYTSYLDAFAKIISPRTVSQEYPYLWCYDIYPIREKNYLLTLNYKSLNPDYTTPIKLSENGELNIKYGDFYSDLEKFKSRTQGKNAVFWSYFQSMTYFAGAWLRPLALEQYLRFSIFSSLAMGCQGILYWTYHQRNNQTKELYLSAPVDMDERKTAIWYYAKKINAEVRKYNYIFKKCKVEKFGHIGETYPDYEAVSGGFECFSGFYFYNKGVLITSLTNNGKKYIVIVSHDVQNYQTIGLRYDTSRYKVSTITTKNIMKADTAKLTPSLQLTILGQLPPGGYMIFEWNEI